jgi:hypothetical protein
MHEFDLHVPHYMGDKGEIRKKGEKDMSMIEKIL